MPGAGAVAGFGAIAAASASAATTAAITSAAITAAITVSVSIGSAFAISALQPGAPSDTDIGRIKDNQIFSSEEGSNIFRCFGERCRVGGTVLWVGPLQYFKENEDIQGVKVARKVFQRSIAIGICHGPIERITRVIANGIEISANPGDVLVTSQGFHVEVRSASTYPGVIALFGILGIGIQRIHMALNSGTDQNLEDFFVGGFLETVGDPSDSGGFNFFFNNSPIPGTAMKIIEVGRTTADDPWFLDNPGATSDLIDAGGSHYVDVLNPLANDEHHQLPPGNDPLLITISQTWDILTVLPGLQYYDRIWLDKLGTEDQEPHELLNREGIPLILPPLTDQAPCYPAFRGIAYVFIKNMLLKDFGDQVPGFEFEIQEKSGRSVGSTIAEMLELGGLSADDYVIDEDLNAIEMRGYVIPGPTPMNKALSPLLRAYNLAVQETNEGRLRFMKRNAGIVWTIKESDLAAHELGEEIPRPLEISDVPDDTLPEQVNIDYVDTSLALNKGSQRERRINLTNRNVMKLDIPITMTPQEARSIAARELWLSVINRQTMRLRLPPSYLLIKENDILLVTADNNDYRIIVTKVERGNNFIIALEGVLESEDAIDLLDSPGEGGEIPAPITGSAIVMPFIIDKGSPIASAHAGTLGIYAAALNISSNPFSTAVLLLTIDEEPLEDGSNIFEVLTLTSDSDFGVALDLPSLTAKPGVWDTESSVTIKMRKGVIASATENTVYQGTNWAMLGSEVIAYKDVTLQGDGSYKLTNLLRGLRDTADEIANHALNPNVEMFVPLRGNNYTFIWPMPDELIGSSLRFGMVAAGGTIDEVIWFDAFTYFGHSGRPFRVNSLEIRKADGANSVRITWAHATSKHYMPFTSEAIPPFLPDREFYQIVIKVGGDEKRLENRIVPYWLYNEADQTADGITPGSTTFTVEVYERANNGRSLIHSGVYVP